MAAILSMFTAYIPHYLFGSYMGSVTDFIVSTVFGTVTYFGILWYLNKLRGGY